MDEESLTILLGIAASLATMGVAYLKSALGSTEGEKSESEKQVDVMLDFIEAFVDGAEEKYPDEKDLRAFNKHLRKLRRMWDTETVTTDDILDYLDGLGE